MNEWMNEWDQREETPLEEEGGVPSSKHSPPFPHRLSNVTITEALLRQADCLRNTVLNVRPGKNPLELNTSRPGPPILPLTGHKTWQWFSAALLWSWFLLLQNEIEASSLNSSGVMSMSRLPLLLTFTRKEASHHLWGTLKLTNRRPQSDVTRGAQLGRWPDLTDVQSRCPWIEGGLHKGVSQK